MATLEDILAGDDDLLDSKPVLKTSPLQDRIQTSFEEISLFVDRHGRVPGVGVTKPEISEVALITRLNSLRSAPAQLRAALAPMDRHGLLQVAAPDAAPTSVEEILASEDPLLATAADDIFTLRHVSLPIVAKAQPEWVTDRKPCEEFARFEPILDACQTELDAGIRKALSFAKESEISVGDFYIVNGMLVYVAEKRDEHKRGNSKRRDARLRCVFSNGTEYRPFLRSLSRALYRDGASRKISDPQAGPLFDSEESRSSGFVYILRSLSADPGIARLDNLHKIGFTTGDVAVRIRNAAQEPTYLKAPVHLLMTIQLHGVSSQRFEALIHRFFGDVRLDLSVTDSAGKLFRPREWFLAPIDVIEKAVGMIADGSIVRHRYDVRTCSIVPV